MNYLYRVTGAVAGCALSIILIANLSDTYQPSLAQSSVSNNESITIRKTATSDPGVPVPGHLDHKIVLALPPKDDGKLWVGKVSWASSEPIEVGFLIAHNQSATDTEHSQVSTLQIENGSSVFHASTNMTGATPLATFGTTDFVVDQLVFHSNSANFTVTYALDAVAKDITNLQ